MEYLWEWVWEEGMHVVALNYCIDNSGYEQIDGIYKSVQALVGTGKPGAQAYPLLKHGAEGGICHEWVLEPHDYITKVEYINDSEQFIVTHMEFWTHQGQRRSFGRG